MSLSPLYCIARRNERNKDEFRYSVNTTVLFFFDQFKLFEDQWKMTNKSIFVISLLICISSIETRESFLQCWKCELSIESLEESGISTDSKASSPSLSLPVFYLLRLSSFI